MEDGCKIDRIAQQYGINNLDSRLQRRRARKDASLRQLESHINRQVLKRALMNSGTDPVDGEAANLLSHLRGDDDINKKEARRELRHRGVEIKAVEEDFVSYQTVRKHLNECMGIDTSETYTPDPEQDRTRMGNLKGRTENVISRTINRLRKYGAIKIGEPRPLVSLKVQCGDCGRTHKVSELLRQRACVCANDDSSPLTGTGLAETNDEDTVDTPR